MITVEKLPDEPIVIVNFLNPFDVNTDISELYGKLRQEFEASPVPVWDITVALDLKLNFGEIVNGLALLTKGNFSILTHPNAAGYVVVADSQLIKLSAAALGQQQYGGISVQVVETIEEAHQIVRQNIAMRSG